MRRHDAPVQLGAQFGQLHPVVDPGDQRGVVDVLGPHDVPVGPEDLDDIGQVKLLLGVVGLQSGQRRAQCRGVERIDARVDLADGLLRRAGVGLFDDGDDLAVLRAQDAPVAGRIGQRRGEHGRNGGIGAVGGDQVGQRIGVEQRYIAVSDHDAAGEFVGQRRQAAADRVAGAELFVLHRDVDGSAEVTAQLLGGGCHLVAVLADHHHEVLRRYLGRRVHCMGQHAAACQGMQHLVGVGAHAGARTGGKDNDRRFGVCSHGPP